VDTVVPTLKLGTSGGLSDYDDDEEGDESDDQPAERKRQRWPKDEFLEDGIGVDEKPTVDSDSKSGDPDPPVTPLVSFSRSSSTYV
jgi:hypothetical protein